MSGLTADILRDSIAALGDLLPLVRVYFSPWAAAAYEVQTQFTRLIIVPSDWRERLGTLPEGIEVGGHEVGEILFRVFPEKLHWPREVA